jgi:hypothetical protein
MQELSNLSAQLQKDFTGRVKNLQVEIELANKEKDRLTECLDDEFSYREIISKELEFYVKENAMLKEEITISDIEKKELSKQLDMKLDLIQFSKACDSELHTKHQDLITQIDTLKQYCIQLESRIDFYRKQAERNKKSFDQLKHENGQLFLRIKTFEMAKYGYSLDLLQDFKYSSNVSGYLKQSVLTSHISKHSEPMESRVLPSTTNSILFASKIHKVIPHIQVTSLDQLLTDAKTCSCAMINHTKSSKDNTILPIAKQFLVSCKIISDHFNYVESLGLVTFSETNSIQRIENKLDKCLTNLLTNTKRHANGNDNSLEIEVDVSQILGHLEDIIDLIQLTRKEPQSIECPDERLMRTSVLNGVTVVGKEIEPFQLTFLLNYMRFQNDRIIGLCRKIFFKDMLLKETQTTLHSICQILDNIVYETRSTVDCIVVDEDIFKSYDLLLNQLENCRANLGKKADSFENNSFNQSFSELIYDTTKVI